MTADGTTPLQPNMIAIRADLTGSTLAGVESPHSLITDSSFFNGLFHSCNLQGITFDASELDGSLFRGCSFRGVELRDCDVEGLVINGVRVGALLRAFLVADGAGNGPEGSGNAEGNGADDGE